MDILEIAAGLRAEGQAFCLATVVRTVAATAAKAGAKAVIRADGTIAEGWIGGGCARGAVLRAARDALADGQPRLVSIMPRDLLKEMGVLAGAERDGVRFARNACPSEGTMDIFIEPVLPLPILAVLGSSPVAVSLGTLAPQFGFSVVALTETFPLADPAPGAQRFIVVSTQGCGDDRALRAAAEAESAYVAFVGSRRKLAAIKASLLLAGVAANRLDRVKGPAGLDLGAITPEEIALSIVAEIVQQRRRGHREDRARQPVSRALKNAPNAASVASET